MTAAQPRPLGSRYELLDLLGTGAMGEVWRALDRETGREVAAKLLRGEYARDTEIVTRFIQERSILMGLRHPNIVQVHDLVVEGDRLGIVMDLVAGGDLRGRLRRSGTLGPREAVAAAGAVLDALAEAHRQGCLHRDVKPDNVLLDGEILGDDPGAVKLSDFSIARLAQESTVMATGLLGTPGYMPPELFVHGHFSAASDVYATGVLLYELLAGRTPFAGSGTAHTIGNRHVTAAPPRIPVDERLWHVVDTMLAKDPRARLSAESTARALRDLPGAALDVPALPVQPTPATWGAAVTSAAPASGPLHVQQAAELDPGATHVRGIPATAAPLAATGEVQALAPGAPVADDQATSVGRSMPSHQAPVLTPGAVQEPERPRKRWVPWVVGAVVLLGLAGGGMAYAQTRGGTSDEPEADPDALPVVSESLPDDPLPSGLAVTRDADYDPETDQLHLTIRYTTQRAPLTGPFLEVIPAADDEQQCPAVVWEGRDQLPNIGRTTGILTPCAYSVELPTIPPQSSAEVTATVDIDLGDDPQAVSQWLDRAAGLTAQSLSGDSVRPEAYPVQRLADIRVDVPSGVTIRTKVLRVLVQPVWVSGPEDNVTVIFDSTATGEPTELLHKIAGGLPGVKLTESCGGAVSIVNHRSVSVVRQADECTIEAEVGNFEAESNTFTISLLGG